MSTLFAWLFKPRQSRQCCCKSKLAEAVGSTNLAVVLHRASSSGLQSAVVDNREAQEKVCVATQENSDAAALGDQST